MNYKALEKKTKNLQYVIWLQTGFIGDIVLTTAAVELLAMHRPQLRQVMITTPLGASLLARQDKLERVFSFDKRKVSLFAFARGLSRQLKEHGIDARNCVLLQVHRSIRSSLLSRLLAIPVIAYRESFSFFAFRVPRVAILHEVERIALLTEPLGIAREQMQALKPRLSTPLDLSAKLRSKWPSANKVVAIAPGSVWATKRWPAESYAELASLLLRQHPDVELVLLGSATEIEQAKTIEEANKDLAQRIHNLAGQTSLEDLFSIYPKLSLLVTNDSSPIHFASAFNVKTLAIFGATIPAMGFAPLAEGSRVVEHELECRPCSDHGPKKCPLSHFLCMKSVKPNKVSQIANAILAT